MKASNEQAMFRVLTGSWLYGTATEKSDYDYKTVVLPPLEVLLLNTKVTNRKEKPEGTGDGDKMKAGETETEYLPLQVFMDDFYSGQTYALEVAFAVVQGKFEVLNSKHGYLAEWVTPEEAACDPLYSFARSQVSAAQQVCRELIDQFLTRNVKKMVGYAVSQAKMYGLKTQRYTSLRQVVDMVHHYMDDNRITSTMLASSALRLSETPGLLKALCRIDHVNIAEAVLNESVDDLKSLLVVTGKYYPLTNRWSTVLASLEKALDCYGQRVKEFDGEGVDWKALSHAIRITGQASELLKTGMLKFPRLDASYQLAVKRGEVPLDEATAHLGELFEEIDPAQEKTELQERTEELDVKFMEWKVQALRRFYGLGEA